MADEDIEATTTHTERALPTQYLHGGAMEPNTTPSSPLLWQGRMHRQPRRSDQDYNQFKARVTEVVNQQHSVSPSSFTSRGRRYAQLRRKKLASIAPFSKKHESRNTSPSGKADLVLVNDSEDQAFFRDGDDDKKERPYTIRETSESSSASQHEWRSALKEQVMSNVKKSQQMDTSRSVHSNYEELMPDFFRSRDIFRTMGSEDDCWSNEHFASPEQSHFEQLDAQSDFRVSPFRPRSSRSLSPSRSRRKRSTSRRRATNEEPTSPKSTTSLRTPRSAIISPRRSRPGNVKSSKSVCSNKSATSKSFFSGTAISENQGSAASSRSRGSSRSPRGSRSRSSSPFKIPALSSPTGRKTYQELSSPESDAVASAPKLPGREDTDYLTVPRLVEPIVESSMAEAPESVSRGSPLIFRDFFTGQSELFVSAPNSPESKRSVVTSNEGSAIQTLSPVHVQSQREENFFEEVQRPSPDLQLFLPRTCTLSVTDGEDNDDVDVLSKVTISTTSGIRIKREDDGSPVGRQIVEHVMAQLEREQEEEEAQWSDEGDTALKSQPPSKERRRRKRKVARTERNNKMESPPEQSPAPREELDAYADPDLDPLEEPDAYADLGPPGLHSPPPIRRIRMEEEDETGSVEQDGDDDDTDDSETEFDPAGDSIPTTNRAYPPTTDGIDPTYHETVLPTSNDVHRDHDSFEMHPLVALSTTDSSSVPYQPGVQYHQTPPFSPYERYRPPSTDPSESFKSFTDSQSRSTILGPKNRRRGEKTRGDRDRTLSRRRRKGGDGDESYESSDSYDTGKGFFRTLCDPVSSFLLCNCMGDIPPPKRQSGTAEVYDHETIDSASYINTTYGRPLPIQSATNLSIEEDDMFDVIESCCG